MNLLNALRSLVFGASLLVFGLMSSAHADVFDDVPEAEGYQLLYALDLSPRGNYIRGGVPYEVDNRAEWNGNFDRVAYYLRLVRAGEEPKFIFVSGNTFTRSGTELGFPLHGLGFSHQTQFGDLTVVSNVEGIVNGVGLRGGNVEMWPGNYAQRNIAGVPNASDAVFDFGDQPVNGAGYSCFQVHNAEARQTLFAYNRWNDNNVADLGIGNNTVPRGNEINTDWTFRANANEYEERRLEVLVRPGFPPPPETIELDTPQPCTVIQRQAGDEAVIEFSGRSTVPADALFWRFEAIDDEEPGEWQPFGPLQDNGSFRGQITLHSGWHAVQLRTTLEDVPVGQITARGVGVGEVFIIAGQSNSANHGQPRLAPVDPRVCATDGESWQQAADPQPIATGNGGSPWPVLGDFLADRFDVPIGFMSVGWGGTSVEQWLPGNARALFPRLQRASNALGPRGARAILWHQGETNAARRTPAEDYAEALTTVIESIREHAGWEIPWGVARVSYLPRAAAEGMAGVIAGQNLVIERVPSVFAGPTTDDLTGEDWRWDNIHFNEAGLREHARRWAEVIELPQCQGLAGVVDMVPCEEPEPDAGLPEDAGRPEDAGLAEDAAVQGDAGLPADAALVVDGDMFSDAQPALDAALDADAVVDAETSPDAVASPDFAMTMDAVAMNDAAMNDAAVESDEGVVREDANLVDAAPIADARVLDADQTEEDAGPLIDASTDPDSGEADSTSNDLGRSPDAGSPASDGPADDGCGCSVDGTAPTSAQALWFLIVLACFRRRAPTSRC